MCNILGEFNFTFCYRKLIRSSLRFGMFLMGLVLMGLEWFFFFFAFLCRVCILLVFLRSLVFFWLFRFCVLPVFLFCSLIFVFSPFFVVFLFFLHLRFFLFVSRDLSVFCTFPGSCCRLSLSLRLRGNCKNPKTKEFRSDPVYTDSVRNFPSDAPFQDSDPMKKALGWPMIRERIPLRKATGPLQIKICQKYFDVMLATNIA